MAITRVGIVEVAPATSASSGVGLPAGLADDDVIVVRFHREDTSAVAPPSGQGYMRADPIDSTASGGTNADTIFVAVLQAADSSTTHTFTHASTWRQVQAIILRGVDVSDILAVRDPATANTGTTTSATTPAEGDPAVAGFWAILSVCSWDNATKAFPATIDGNTLTREYGSLSQNLGLARAEYASSAAISSAAVTLGSAPVNWLGKTILVRPDSGLDDAPTVVGAGTASWTATSGANLTPGLPSGWAADDIHVLIAHRSDNTAMTSLSGWTLLSAANNTAAQRVELWVRRAVGGDAAPTVTFGTGTVVRGAQIVGIRGVPTSVTLSALELSRSNNAASATITFATLTPTPARGLLLALYAYEDDPTTAAQIDGWTDFVEDVSALGNDASLGWAWRTWPVAASATGALTSTASGGTFANSPNVGILISFQPITAGAATAYNDVATRLRLAAQGFKDAVARLRLRATGYDDVGLRARLAGPGFKDVAARFVLRATGYRDAATRLILSVRGYRDAATRLRLRATAYRDATARFRLLAPTTSYRDAVARLQLGVGAYRDATTRLVLRATAYRDAAARFRVYVLAYRDAATRLRLRATGYRDAAFRFRLTGPAYIDAVLRLALRTGAYRDAATRLVLYVRNYRDAAIRLRLAATAYRDVTARLRLRATGYRDAVARLRASVLGFKDTIARLRLRVTGYRDAATRFVLAAPGAAYDDATTRLRLRAIAYRDAVARFALRARGFRDVVIRTRIRVPGWRDAVARLRLRATAYRDATLRMRLGVRGYRDAAGRLRLRAMAFRDATGRVRVRALAYRDATGRLVLVVGGARDAVLRLRTRAPGYAHAGLRFGVVSGGYLGPGAELTMTRRARASLVMTRRARAAIAMARRARATLMIVGR